MCAIAFGSLPARSASPQAPTLIEDSVQYKDACDGSAAVALSADTFVVAHDDDNTLRIYRVGTPDPILKVPFAVVLGAKKEVDIEGAARIGDVIYWIGSHGRDSKGDDEPTRRRLFATRIVTTNGDTRLEPEGRAYDGLLADLIQPLLTERGFPLASTKAPESEGALNIEGLAAAGDRLLIGLRNPLPHGKALVVEVTNPARVIGLEREAAARGRVFEIDLGGRGIRSIESIGDAGGYLIVAGPFDKGAALEEARKPLFTLYRWPSFTATPERLEALVLPRSFGAEALFHTPGTAADPRGSWVLLSDDGDALVNGTRCKDVKPASEKRFHRATFTLN